MIIKQCVNNNLFNQIQNIVYCKPPVIYLLLLKQIILFDVICPNLIILNSHSSFSLLSVYERSCCSNFALVFIIHSLEKMDWSKNLVLANFGKLLAWLYFMRSNYNLGLCDYLSWGIWRKCVSNWQCRCQSLLPPL